MPISPISSSSSRLPGSTRLALRDFAENPGASRSPIERLICCAIAAELLIASATKIQTPKRKITAVSASGRKHSGGQVAVAAVAYDEDNNRILLAGCDLQR